jgi:hypothetical protein
MPDRRKHRGAHPEDQRLFAASQVVRLQTAVVELAWLLTRGYPSAAALKLVGDRHTLLERQRTAVARATCGDAAVAGRKSRCLSNIDLRGADLAIDGFNLIITIEAALSGGVLLRCRDSTLRDLASIHGSYRTVEETDAAIELIGSTLKILEPAHVLWLLDSPVSNSGRLAVRLREAARDAEWPWSVETVFDPDKDLVRSDAVVVTSDSNVLDGAGRWTDIASRVVAELIPDAWIVDLSNVPS